MFDGDRPIQNSSQDRLGRAIFAKYLARCIIDHPGKESLVVGLYGGWGVGKTSVINMTLEELNYAAGNMFDADKPIILNFNPWIYSGQNQLVYSFFRRLSSEIRHFPHLENSERIIHLLELYISFFTHRPVPKALRPKHGVWHDLFGNEEVKEMYGWESGQDLTIVKAELNELLKIQRHKIIIFIDNIGRLKPEEIKNLIQIMKSLADYANTIYVLAFNQELVLTALTTVYGSGAKELMEKVVQLPFEIPPISRQDLENILLDRLQNILSTYPNERWNTDYWADVFYSTLKHVFKNCRDITRYVNTVSFSYQRVREIVNPVDFFAITVLQVFEPKVYAGIRDNKDLFTDLIDHVYPGDAEQTQKDKFRLDEILNRTTCISKNVLEQLILRLFPRVRYIYQKNLSFYHSEAIARKNLRICSPDVFDIYFRLSMPSGFIPEAEMHAILKLSADRLAFSEALARLNQDEKILKFLDELDGTIVNLIPKTAIRNVIAALMDDGDLFPIGNSSALSFNTPMRIHRLFQQLLSQFENTDERAALLEEAIHDATKSLYIIIHEIEEQTKEHTETEDTYVPIEHRHLTPEQLQNMQQLAVEKIKLWARNERLGEHPQLLPVLYAWKKWGNADECKKYVNILCKTDRGIIAFLEANLKTPIDEVIQQSEHRTDWKKSLTHIEDFISVTSLEPHAKELFENDYFEKLREREQLALMIFLDLINAQTIKVIPKTTV